jgi:hypothetical protein
VKIAAICCTYKRPTLLAHAIESFLVQDYPAELRELIVLDDVGQYEGGGGEGWQMVSFPRRFRTLGEKRNASAALVSPDVDAYCVWDDDDIYLPWHMSAAAAALEAADYSIPSVVYAHRQDRLERITTSGKFHGAWAFRREAFDAVGGYPFIQSGQDLGLVCRFRERGLRMVDPIERDPRPSYVYRWRTTHPHISELGAGGYEAMGALPGEHAGRVVPVWDRDWVKLHEASGWSRDPAGIESRMSAEEIALWSRYVAEGAHYWEFGAGGSTVLAATRAPNLRSIHAVENDRAWVKELRALPGLSGVVFHTLYQGPTGACGYPRDGSRAEGFPLYAQAIRRADPPPDVVLVAGRFRVACCAEALLHAPGAAILFHDFRDRPRYHGVLPFVDVVERAGTTAVLRRRAGAGEEALRALAAAHAADPA